MNSKIFCRSQRVSGTSKLSTTNLYLSLRQHYSEGILLEAADYQADVNNYSYLAFDPIAQISLSREGILNDSLSKRDPIDLLNNPDVNLSQYVSEAISSIVCVGLEPDLKRHNGFFGYTSFDAVSYFDSLKLKNQAPADLSIPIIHYQVYRFVIVVDNQRNTFTLINNELAEDLQRKEFDLLVSRIKNLKADPIKSGEFSTSGKLSTNIEADAYASVIEGAKEYIQKGDIFQVVPSRSFDQGYSGDEFAVYEQLKKINPSPYLFYFDFADFKLFGSSPEAAIIVSEQRAILHPIAGTAAKTDDPAVTAANLAALVADPKENSEHVMLVDLARNDLSKHCTAVQVDKFCEVQNFSHVMHLVSVVSGKLMPDVQAYQLLADTFPAGTLSGAPKYRAIEIIDELENDARQYYGGAIGLITLNNQLVHAIMIRTFLAKNNIMTRRAGGGIVAESEATKEFAEVKNKLAALAQAIELARDRDASEFAEFEAKQTANNMGENHE